MRFSKLIHYNKNEGKLYQYLKFPKHSVTTITNVQSKQKMPNRQADRALPYLELAPMDSHLTWSRIISSPQTTSILLEFLP